jgi:asparagine synthase (glutamine-hydrolysing)
MENLVPTDIVWRRDKVGFETPQLEWLTALLRDETHWFGPQALSGQYLNFSYVRQQLPLLMQQLETQQGLLWRLLNLEAWLRVWQAASV